jgi:hypothetical protein
VHIGPLFRIASRSPPPLRLCLTIYSECLVLHLSPIVTVQPPLHAPPPRVLLTSLQKPPSPVVCPPLKASPWATALSQAPCCSQAVGGGCCLPACPTARAEGRRSGRCPLDTDRAPFATRCCSTSCELQVRCSRCCLCSTGLCRFVRPVPCAASGAPGVWPCGCPVPLLLVLHRPTRALCSKRCVAVWLSGMSHVACRTSHVACRMWRVSPSV